MADYPVSIPEWEAASPGDHRKWLGNIANECLWSSDPAEYDYVTTLAVVLERQKFRYVNQETKKEENMTKIGNATVNVYTTDESLVDIRKFAIQKAIEILDFSIIEADEEAKALVKAAKKIEKYIVGSSD